VTTTAGQSILITGQVTAKTSANPTTVTITALVDGSSVGTVSITGVGNNEYVTVPIAVIATPAAGTHTVSLSTTFPVGSGTVQTASVAGIAY
jgi:hypothetical protein